MHKDWRLTPLKALTVTFAACALALNAHGAFAEGLPSGDSTDPDIYTKSYVLESSGGTWGDAQDAAVIAAGGTVTFKHLASGLGLASSTQDAFMRKALKSPAFIRVSEDVTVQWQDPSEQVQAVDSGLEEDAVTPGNETFINLQWNVKAIDAQGAWNAGYDGLGVRVAVIDGGMCSNHVDIAPNLDVAHSISFVPGFAYNQDVGGVNTFRHACHVAGIIAAADNSIGTIGVAPRATIIGVKALHNGSGSFGQVISAILYSATPIADGGAGADIINMSLGAVVPRGGGNTGVGGLIAAMNRAVNFATSQNVLVVSAAGNNALDLDHSTNLIELPGMSGSGIAVSATAPVGYAVGYPNSTANPRAIASYTNYGHSIVSLAAPGGDALYIPQTQGCSIPRVPSGAVVTNCFVFDLVISPGSQNNGYFFASGTSMATPVVAGVAALVRQRFPGISVGDLKSFLLATADDEGESGADPFYGHGFVNANRAATEPLSIIGNNPVVQSVAPATGVELSITRKSGSSIPEITFATHKAGPVRVELFDLAGRNVVTLYNGVAAAGRTTVTWNGRSAHGQELARGAYFARVRADGAQAVQKMLLLGN
jgi:subtilisin family serine protease